MLPLVKIDDDAFDAWFDQVTMDMGHPVIVGLIRAYRHQFLAHAGLDTWATVASVVTHNADSPHLDILLKMLVREEAIEELAHALVEYKTYDLDGILRDGMTIPTPMVYHGHMIRILGLAHELKRRHNEGQDVAEATRNYVKFIQGYGGEVLILGLRVAFNLHKLPQDNVKDLLAEILESLRIK